MLLKFSCSQSFPMGVKCLSCFLCNEKLNLAQKYQNVHSNVGKKINKRGNDESSTSQYGQGWRRLTQIVNDHKILL